MLYICKDNPQAATSNEFDEIWYVWINNIRMPKGVFLVQSLAPRRYLAHLYASDAISINSLLLEYANDLRKGIYNEEIDALVKQSSHKDILIITPEDNFIQSTRRILYNYITDYVTNDVALY